MVKRVAILAALATACAASNPHLETRVDNLTTELAKMRRELDDLRQQLELERARSRPEQPGQREQQLADKLAELSRRLDQLAARNLRPARNEPDRAQVYAIPVDGYPSHGPADAKVTLVMMRDYACPFSEKSRATLADLRTKYGNDLRIVYRNFIVHPQTATAAALAACAAARQGQFDAIDDALWEKGFKARTFDERQSGSDACWTTPEGCKVALGFARDAHLKLDRFKDDMRSCQADLSDDMREMVRFAIGSTPSFFINGRYTVGAAPAEVFERLIDEELAKANQRIQAGTPKAAYYKTWVLGKGLTKVDTTAPTPVPVPAPPSGNGP
ncbi:MAG TPA: thioredoxin domain-containing protein [Kofleriaceae bacterium]|jgi:protein-disulfide isomerase|nr:thioredoxin domain-containing protein [Kofleriaceae bacterium]